MLRILFVILLSIATLLTAAGWYVRLVQPTAYWAWRPLSSLDLRCDVKFGKATVSARVWQVTARVPRYGNLISFTMRGISLQVGEFGTSTLRPGGDKLATVVSLYVSPWVLTGVTALVGLGLPLVTRRRKRRRRKRGLCVKCGYDLRGNESGVCPECGEKVGVRS